MNISTVYIEKELIDHPRVKQICAKVKPKRTIVCERYSEVFNRKAQNFRLQKEQPALILAKKYGKFIHPVPIGYGIGGKHNYYFSHVLNCPFDCQYCFLQGMYRSAHYVLFINYEQYWEAIEKEIQKEPTYFFSGFDGDSLALEPVTQFAKEFLPFFAKHPDAFIEMRTKSLFIRPLLQREPINNCIVAYSLNPAPLAKHFEDKAPPLEKRLQAIDKLQKKGWKIGLRFDPILYCEPFEKLYREFFRQVFSVVQEIHSATLGALRLPKGFFKNMEKLGAGRGLLATLDGKNLYSYPKEKELLAFCREQILQYIPKEKLFLCADM